ncbi:hypothetical protein ACFFLM_05600 [Deinococcus oregonensis]|uniref:Uncharacterized protein n=1 Tax=Deinococcus oregonensis TaxID=1805970 RepID=A0ABV6AVB0_9DEIO
MSLLLICCCAPSACHAEVIRAEVKQEGGEPDIALSRAQLAMLNTMKDGDLLTVFNGFPPFTPPIVLIGSERFSVSDFQVLYELGSLFCTHSQLGLFSRYILSAAGLLTVQEAE